MEQRAKVVRILDGNKAEVLVQRESACGHDCSTCQGCNAPNQTILVTANNLVGAAAQDWVLIESPSSKIISLSLIVYILPILLFFFGYLFGKNLTHLRDGLNSLLGLAIGILICFYVNRRISNNKQNFVNIIAVL